MPSFKSNSDDERVYKCVAVEPLLEVQDPVVLPKSTLTTLFKKYAQWTDKQTVHKYGEIYDELLKNRDVSMVAEIGVSAGGSIAVWDEYFPAASVHGVDVSLDHARIVEDGKPMLFGREKVHLYEVNAYDAMFALPFPEVDLFVDDGPHTVDSQTFAIKYYLPKVRAGGVFVIEDIQSVADGEYLMQFVPDEWKSSARIVDISNETGRYDDRLLIVEK
jgi:cephalosporin hydroxylase